MSEDVREQFGCPVTWCTGGVEEHGGDGAGPEDWLHQSEAVPLAGELWAQRWTTGADPERWQLHVSTDSEIAEARNLASLAALLESAARELRRAAATL